MYLEMFNDTRSCIYFDVQRNTFSLSESHDHCFSGIGVSDQDGLSALYCLGGRLYFLIDGNSIDVTEDDITYSYHHDGNGMTHFSLMREGGVCVKKSYVSWSMTGASEPIGFGMAEDDEEDFFAYMKLMLEAKNRKLHLLKKYSQ